MMLALHALRPLIERAWSRETTYSPDEWPGHDPAWGQCAVTAVLLQRLLGGDLLMGTACLPCGRETNHFWNRLDGVEVDLTARQFPVGTELRDACAVTEPRAIQCRWMRERLARLIEAFDNLRAAAARTVHLVAGGRR
jgi:hypothetical protein